MGGADCASIVPSSGAVLYFRPLQPPQRFFGLANIASQIKRNRQTKGRHDRNKAVRSELKTRIRNALDAAETGDQSAAAEQLRLAQRHIDKAVSKGLIHKKTAARRKARLTKQVSGLLG